LIILQDSALGRYTYYPSSTASHMGSQRDSYSSSRMSTRSSFNLLPNKYSILNKANNNNNNNLPPSSYGTSYINGHGDYHHHVSSAAIPGAYDHPFGSTGGDSGSWGHSQSDLGSLSRLKSKPLQPIVGVRDKFFDSTRTSTSYSSSTSNSNHTNKITNGSATKSNTTSHKADSLRSDSQQSESTDETESEENDSESQSDEKTDDRLSEDNDNNKSAHSKSQSRSSVPQSSTDTSPQHTKVVVEKVQEQKMDNPRQVPITQRKGSEITSGNGITREYQVYHHRIEVEPTAAAALVASITKKRGDADSAGSSHTRDSGVSFSSVPGSKTVSLSCPLALNTQMTRYMKCYTIIDLSQIAPIQSQYTSSSPQDY